MTTEFAKRIHASVLNSDISAQALAKRIGKPYSTLLREINPYDQGAKLGVQTFIDIVKVTGDTSLVEYIAHELGLELAPRPLRKTG
jgi:hypothetical protein